MGRVDHCIFLYVLYTFLELRRKWSIFSCSIYQLTRNDRVIAMSYYFLIHIHGLLGWVLLAFEIAENGD